MRVAPCAPSCRSAPPSAPATPCLSPSAGSRRAPRLPPKIQPPVRKTSVNPEGINHEPDPWPDDRGIGQVDVFADQAIAAVPRGIDQPVPSAIVPVEPQIDPFADDAHLRAALFPIFRRVAWDRRVSTAIPAARPRAFKWIE